jgi:hypothetical protein
MLSAPGVRSRVGAVTVGAKSGSKTGLSHIFDWALLLGFVSKSADPLAVGRLIAKLRARSPQKNPYILGLERLVYARAYVLGDFDVFRYLVLYLAKFPGAVKKKESSNLFARIVEELASIADGSRSLSNSQKAPIFDAMTDLERAARRSDSLGGTSTAWHRASSRMEMLVDLGLLEKGTSERTYEYFYMPNDRLRHAANTFADEPCQVWLDKNLLAVFGPPGLRPSQRPELTVDSLSDALTLISAGSPLVGIDDLCLALAILACELGAPLNLKDVRDSVIEFARNNPDVARLSAGRYSREAEFISIRRQGRAN